jgi:hypothetical protein
MSKLDEFKNDIGDIKILIAEMPKKIIDECDSRYASKLSEIIIYGMSGLVLTSFITALIYFLIKH